MNIFKTLETIIEGRTDDEMVPLSVSNIKRMIESANMMNEKAAIIRAYYRKLLSVPEEKLAEELKQVDAVTEDLI